MLSLQSLHLHTRKDSTSTQGFVLSSQSRDIIHQPLLIVMLCMSVHCIKLGRPCTIAYLLLKISLLACSSLSCLAAGVLQLGQLLLRIVQDCCMLSLQPATVFS